MVAAFRRSRHRIALWLGLAACSHPTPPAPPEVSPAPVLPAPEAPLYALGVREPRDPVVAALVRDGLLPWVESLSGAAGAMLLEPDRPATLHEARFRAVRAGYPYPVVAVVGGEASADEEPPDLLATLGPLVRPTDHVGLARARVGDRDRWMALVGRPRVALEPFPREVQPGDAVKLVSDPPARWRLLAPSGAVLGGWTPASFAPDDPGEWWLELRGEAPGRRGAPGEVVAAVPLYVGVPTPVLPDFDVPGPEVSGPAEAVDLALDLVGRVRERRDLVVPALDDTLATLERRPLERFLAGTWDREEGERRLRGAGYVGGPVHELACRAESVAACVAAWMGTFDDRAALLDPGVRVAGLAARVDTEGVALALALASE